MPLSPSTRDKLATVGTATLGAALARHGLSARRIDDARPLSPTQDPLVGEASTTLENCRSGTVLVVDAGRPLPPAGLLARRGVAGIVSAGRLRASAEIVRAGLPAYEFPSESGRSLAIPDGDVIVGDRQGVIVIPAALVDEIAEEATDALAFEAFTAEQVDAGGGVYGLHIPSGEPARIAFAAWRKLRRR